MSVSFRNTFQSLERRAAALRHLEELCDQAALPQDDLSFYAMAKEINQLARRTLRTIAQESTPEELDQLQFYGVETKVKDTIERAQRKIDRDITKLEELFYRTNTTEDIATLQRIAQKIQHLNIRKKLSFFSKVEETLKRQPDRILERCNLKILAIQSQSPQVPTQRDQKHRGARERDNFGGQALTAQSYSPNCIPDDKLPIILKPWSKDISLWPEKGEQCDQFERAIYTFVKDRNEKTLRLRLDASHQSPPPLPSRLFQISALVQRLKTFHLHYEGLILPTQIGCLTALQQLNLRGNKFTEIPTQIGCLTGLQSLNLSGNKFTAVPTQIGRLTDLQKLNLSDNNLAVLPTEMTSLTGLRELDLSNNSFITLPTELGRLTALTELTLYYLHQLTAVPAEILELAPSCAISIEDDKLPAGVAERLKGMYEVHALKRTAAENLKIKYWFLLAYMAKWRESFGS